MSSWAVGRQLVGESPCSVSTFFRVGCGGQKFGLRQLARRGFPAAQLVKDPPAMPETWVQSLGWEDPLRRAWQPMPVFLPGEPHGQRSLAGYSPWGCRVGHD